MADQITSTANPRIKALVRLRNRRERDATGTFLVDGAREVGRALDASTAIEVLYACRPMLGAPAEQVVRRARAGGVPILDVAQEPFRRVAYGERDDGVLAVARCFPTGLGAVDLEPDPVVLVVESIEKPGNLGTMLRTAEAAAAAAVLVADPVVDLFNPNVVRASMGALFTVPVAAAPADAVRAWLSEQGVPWWASSQHGAVELWSADLTGPVALVVGSESDGLSPEWLADPSRVVTVPAAGVGSLNAATAAAVLLFEAIRQRSAG